jgi:hypothetical protein
MIPLAVFSSASLGFTRTLPAKILPFNCAILSSFKVKHHFLTSYFSIFHAK